MWSLLKIENQISIEIVSLRQNYKKAQSYLPPLQLNNLQLSHYNSVVYKKKDCFKLLKTVSETAAASGQQIAVAAELSVLNIFLMDIEYVDIVRDSRILW